MPARIEAVLTFWFGLSRTEPAAVRDNYPRWFGADAATDAEIAERFGELYQQAVAGALSAWEQTPRGALALIILLDQFSRSLYRRRPEAFAMDPVAQRLCLDGLRLGHDEVLSPLERAFFYMPLQHAEFAHLQDLSVERYEALVRGADEAWREALQGFLDYAREHRDIIHRFGRFPHRNRVLGRTSTPAEEAFLAGGASSYGQ